MDIERAVTDMAYAIRRAVRPNIGLHSAKEIIGKTESGDEAFGIDELAEEAIVEFIRKHELPVAYYTEGRGLIQCANPKYLLIIDPIDGTRPAMVGLEGGVVSIAAAPYSLEACMGDVAFGCVLELKTNRMYTASRDGLVHIKDNSIDIPVDLRLITELSCMSWSFELAGRPVLPIIQVLSPIIDKSSLAGGVFVISGSAFSLTRMVSGQFDAVVDIGNRILRDYPELHQDFIRAGNGSVIGLFPYDIAAAALIAETAGCKVTDAYGDSLDGVPLLDTSEANIRSCIAASNPVLHEKLLSEVNEHMQALASVL